MKPSSRSWSTLSLLLVCALYLVFACLYLREPGLEYDEVLFANAALGDKDGSFIWFDVSVDGAKVPLMLMSYIGAVKAFVYAPIFALFPPSPISVRLPAILAGLLAMVATYFFVAYVFDRRTALIAALLLASDPSYIYHTRLDWGPVALMLLFKMTSLYCFARFAKTRRVLYLAAGAFLLGLGLYDKAVFVWFLAALLLAALVVWRRQWRQWVTRRNTLTVALFFFLGCWPLLLYNALTLGGSLKGQLSLPVDMWRSIQDKTHVLLSTLDGTAVSSFVQPMAARATLMLEILLGCLVVTGYLLLRRRLEKARPLAFLLLLSLGILLLLYVTPMARGSHHFMMLYPFPQILVAFVCSTLVGRVWAPPGRRRTLRHAISYAAIVSLVVLITSNAIVDTEYLRSFSHEGGRGIWSDAIYDLAAFAQENPRYSYALMDWGFGTQMLLLSRGAIVKDELFYFLEDPARVGVATRDELADWLYHRWMRSPASVFVFHAPAYTLFDQPKMVFDAMLERHDLRSQLLKVFRQRNGDPVYLLYEVVPATPAADFPIMLGPQEGATGITQEQIPDKLSIGTPQ